MASYTPRIVTIGNALVDILAQVDHGHAGRHGLEFGTMTLVNPDTARSHYAAVTPLREIAGGSAANTAVIAGLLGADVGFIGKIGSDPLGEVFETDLEASGVVLDLSTIEEDDTPTGRCLSMITPDGQRTMSTHLGAASHLGPEDIDIYLLSDSEIVLLEGYLLDTPLGYHIFGHVFKHARRRIALTLSDPDCVRRHIDYLSEIIRDYKIDILFCNTAELEALYPGGQFENRMIAASCDFDIVVATDGANGVYLANYRRISHLAALPVDVVDTTGAGDSFAGTCLWAIDAGLSLTDAARMALIVAAEIISGVGARPQRDLNQIIAERWPEMAA